MKTFLLVAFLVITFCDVEAQRAGTLDSSFGENGILVQPASANISSGSGITQPDNKILILGSGSSQSGLPSLIVTRYMDNGKIDNQFGVNGSAYIPFENISVRSVGIALAADGGLIVAGWGAQDQYYTNFLLGRLFSDGRLDSSFGINGKVAIFDNAEFTNDYATAVALQTNNKILVTGFRTQYTEQERNTQKFLLKRYLPNGEPDSSFGDNGAVAKQLEYFDESTCVVCQPDGKIIQSGDVFGIYGEQKFGLIRFLENGTTDSSFGGGDGMVITDAGSNGDNLNALKLQGDGKIIAVGATNIKVGTKSSMVAVRYMPDGTRDQLFGQDGKVSIRFDNRSAEATSVLLLRNNNIILSGKYFNEYLTPVLNDFALISLRPDGTLDSNFGTNGKTITDLSGNDDCFSSDLLTNGKIILMGWQQDTDIIAFARYYGDSLKPSSPIVKKIKRWIRNHTLNWQYNNDDIDYFVIEQSNNGTSGFKEIAKVKAGKSNTYYYSLNNLIPNNKADYRITAINTDSSKVISDVINDEDIISILVSPNPVTDVLKITGLPANQKVIVSIVDRNGNVLQSSTSYPFNSNMNVSGLHSGLYNLQVNVNGKLMNVKFVKE